MLIEQTIEKMRLLKLNKMAGSLTERLSRPDHQSLPVAEFIGYLVDDEYQHRQNQKMQSRLRQAKFKESQACLEDIDYSPKRNLTKKIVMDLAQNTWLRSHQSIVMTGKTGAGKSYLGQALGNHACKNGFSVMYIRCPKLFSLLKVARADGTYLSKLKSIHKMDLIILDDFGVTQIDEEKRQDLFEIIEDRYQVKSTIVTTQLLNSQWHEYLGGGMVADAKARQQRDLVER
jgi:DNA replication protein DnaC